MNKTIDMAAPEGNKFWRLRSKHGRDKLFATPELLWNAACEYFDWCDNHPWTVVKNKTKGKKKEKKETPTQRPYTIGGFLLYCDANSAYWRQFKQEDHEDFSTVISRIESIIETQQYEGAVVGAYNANIISRKLGLSDKQEINNTGSVSARLSINIVNSPTPLAGSENEVED